MAILQLDRNYSDVQPRLPEGGPDGGHDIECYRGPDLCFGAVGFVNNASDTPKEKRQIIRKFEDDLDAALRRNQDLKAFVFFTNVNLTPGEIEKLQKKAHVKGVSLVDIYRRERIRMALDSPEGLGFRYSFLEMPLSEAEQASFFSRFGKDLERLLTGGIERIEKKLDLLEFSRWQAGRIRSINLHVKFKELEKFPKSEPEHFRVCLELQSVAHEKRSMILGGQADYQRSAENAWHFGIKTFFFRQRFGKIEGSWIPSGPRVSGKYVGELDFGVIWRPTSEILAAEFDNLDLNFHFTENLLDRIARVKFNIDSYVFLDRAIRLDITDQVGPSLGWPDVLTKEQAAIEWRYCDLGSIVFDRLPKIKDDRDY